ncbi:uncharacterized protein LOC141648176 [Silene latifolia]|uniref:uncharacterized protein LOC141648176 n=1 Tax=Silene latifolia TaxID=37657 RepID=UPI003D771949
MQRKISIPSTFASICWFSSLFAILFFSFLYLHPRDPNNCLNTLHIDASKEKVTSSFKYVSSEFTDVDNLESLDGLSSKVVVNSTTSTDNNVPDVQVSDSAIFELGLNFTSNELPPNNVVAPIIEEAVNATVIELVEKAPPPKKEDIDDTTDQASNGTVIDIVEKAPPTNKDDTTDQDDEGDDEGYDIIPSFDVLSNPPWNISRANRILWLKQKLEESKIIKSTSRTRNFDEKMQSFLKQGCTERFFFTWISPASLFGKESFLS